MVAVAFDSKAEGLATTSTSVTVSITIVAASDQNRIALITAFNNLGSGTGQNVSGITFDGVAATLANRVVPGDVTNVYEFIETWYVLDADLPPAAGTYDVVVTVSSSATEIGANVAVFTGLKQQAHEATGIYVSSSDESILEVTLSSITANAVGYGSGYNGGSALAALNNMTGTGETLLNDTFAASNYAFADIYNLDLGAVGSKKIDWSSGSMFGVPRMVATIWEIDTAAPVSVDNSAAIMMGASF